MRMSLGSLSPPTRSTLLAVGLFAASLLAASTQGSDETNKAARALAALERPTTVRLEGAIAPGTALTLDLALGETALKLDLQPLSYRAPDFKLEVVEKGRSRFVDPGPVRTVQGELRGVPGIRVLGAVKPAGLELTITLPSGRVLELRPMTSKVETSTHALYSLTPVSSVAVGAKYADHGDDAPRPVTMRESSANKMAEGCASNGFCGARIAFDTDSLYYSTEGGTPQSVLASVESTLAFINDKFYNLNIRHELAGVRVRPTTTDDPYDDVLLPNGAVLRGVIRDEWVGTLLNENTDLVHLLTGISTSNGGQSPVPGVCDSFDKYAYSRNLGVFCSEDAVTTHELGHSWGSHHTLNGIMQSGNSFCENDWDTVARAAIESQRNAVDSICLDLIPMRRAEVSILSLPHAMNGSETYAATAKVKNTGVLNWSLVGPVTQAYRLAQVGNAAWLPLRIELPAPLAVGQEVTIPFTVTAPNLSGVRNFQLQMVQEDVEFFSSASAVVPVTIAAKNASLSQPLVPTAMVPGRSYAASITVQNTGDVAWNPIGPSCNAFRLGFVGSGAWSPIRVELPAALAPGNQATLNFNVTAPASPGTYTFQWQMVHECVEWFGTQSPAVTITVTP